VPPEQKRVTFRTLLDNWQQKAQPVLTPAEYQVRLPVDDAARIHALAELYPGHTREEIITGLLGVALRELEAAMPYVRGTRVISRDEQGDPIYEDAGPTPRFNELLRRHRRKLGSPAKG
jgi:hypothetical protein